MVSSNSYTDKEPKVVMIADKNADTDTYVTINTRDTSFDVVIPPGGSKVVALPSQVMVVDARVSRPPGAIQVTSSLPITVYGLNDAYAYEPRSDGFRVLSTDRLGTEYFLVTSYKPYGSYPDIRAQFVVIGLHDNTEISMKLVGPLFFHGALHYGGTTIRFRVRVLETLFIVSNGHAIGTHVLSNKPVSILSGSDCGYGSYQSYGDDSPEMWPCEHQVEHMVPVQSWGQDFVFKEFHGYEGGNMYVTIIAARDGTHIRYPNHEGAFLDAGKSIWYQTEPNNSRAIITADKPIMVVARSDYAPLTDCHSNCSGTDYSSPAMTLIPPLTPLVGNLAFVHLDIENANHTYNYVDIVFECSKSEHLILNDKSIALWGVLTRHIVDDNYCSVTVDVDEKVTYYLAAIDVSVEVSAVAYGFSGTSSFAFPLL